MREKNLCSRPVDFLFHVLLDKRLQEPKKSHRARESRREFRPSPFPSSHSKVYERDSQTEDERLDLPVQQVLDHLPSGKSSSVVEGDEVQRREQDVRESEGKHGRDPTWRKEKERQREKN